MESSNCCNGWTKLYHPRGPQVTLPVNGQTAGEYFAAVSAYLDAGFLVEPAGAAELASGEIREEVSAILMRLHYSQGKSTPQVRFYSSNDRLKHGLASRFYLNTPEEIESVEAASGLKLSELPDFPGDNLDRDGSPRARQYIIAAKKPFFLVYKENPYYSAADHEAAKAAKQPYIKPKYKFVRCESANPVQQPAPVQPDPMEDEYIVPDEPEIGNAASEIERQIDEAKAQLTACDTEANLAAAWVRLPVVVQNALVNHKDVCKAKLRQTSQAPAPASTDPMVGRELVGKILGLLAELGIDWDEVRQDRGKGAGLPMLVGFRASPTLTATQLTASQGLALFRELEKRAAAKLAASAARGKKYGPEYGLA